MLSQEPAKVKLMPITQVIDTLKFLHPGGEVFELCLIGPKTPISKFWEGRAGGKKQIVSGWFRDPGAAAKLAVQVAGEGVYITLNPCKEALLARADQRLQAGVDRTADQHIVGIKNLLIDIDPQRPTGISSTDQEHEAALEMAQIIKADLTKEGWHDPLAGDSGNGGHLVYPLDLPNDQESVALVKGVLEALALCYADQLKSRNLEIDLKVFNPARLTKLYGTMVRKGDNTQDRPHRMAQIISLPEARRPVPLELLKKLAATVQAQGSAQAQTKESGEGRFDLAAYLKHYRVEVAKVKPHRGGMLYCLQECIFDPSHSGNEAAIGQAADGKLFFQCFHRSCRGRTWAEARQKISGGAKLTDFIIGGGSRISPIPTPPADYDRAERAAIQAEAPAPVHKKTLVLGSAMTTAAAEALRAAGWEEDKISHVSNILEQSEKGKGNFNLAAEVREWVLSSSGVFLSSDFVKETGLSSMSSREFNKNLSKVFERLVKDGVIEREGSRRGQFRRIERESEIIDFATADCSTTFDLRWPAPFHLERLIDIYPKNVIIVAGATNAGKTALLLNVVRENMAQHRIIYFSSELGAKELRLRLEKFQMPISAWAFEARERGGNFADVIIPDAVNIIDYFELTDNFYQIGGEIKKIFDRLMAGIAIIAIQKDEDKDLARGGGFSAEKARLYLSINPGELKITKAKNWAQPGHNPNWKIFKFKLIDGCKFIEG